MSVPVALRNEIPDALAGIFREVADDGKPDAVGGEFLQDFACHAGAQVKKFRRDVFFVQDDLSDALEIKVAHDIQGVLRGPDQQPVGDYLADGACLGFMDDDQFMRL